MLVRVEIVFAPPDGQSPYHYSSLVVLLIYYLPYPRSYLSLLHPRVRLYYYLDARLLHFAFAAARASVKPTEA